MHALKYSFKHPWRNIGNEIRGWVVDEKHPFGGKDSGVIEKCSWVSLSFVGELNEVKIHRACSIHIVSVQQPLAIRMMCVIH